MRCQCFYSAVMANSKLDYSRDHGTSTLYKPDTSLRRTVEARPDGVRLRERANCNGIQDGLSKLMHWMTYLKSHDVITNISSCGVS